MLTKIIFSCHVGSVLHEYSRLLLGGSHRESYEVVISSGIRISFDVPFVARSKINPLQDPAAPRKR
jgi:hypothetical protein